MKNTCLIFFPNMKTVIFFPLVRGFPKIDAERRVPTASDTRSELALLSIRPIQGSRIWCSLDRTTHSELRRYPGANKSCILSGTLTAEIIWGRRLILSTRDPERVKVKMFKKLFRSALPTSYWTEATRKLVAVEQKASNFQLLLEGNAKSENSSRIYGWQSTPNRIDSGARRRFL